MKLYDKHLSFMDVNPDVMRSIGEFGRKKILGRLASLMVIKRDLIIKIF